MLRRLSADADILMQLCGPAPAAATSQPAFPPHPSYQQAPSLSMGAHPLQSRQPFAQTPQAPHECLHQQQQQQQQQQQDTWHPSLLPTSVTSGLPGPPRQADQERLQRESVSVTLTDSDVEEVEAPSLPAHFPAPAPVHTRPASLQASRQPSPSSLPGHTTHPTSSAPHHASLDSGSTPLSLASPGTTRSLQQQQQQQQHIGNGRAVAEPIRASTSERKAAAVAASAAAEAKRSRWGSNVTQPVPPPDPVEVRGGPVTPTGHGQDEQRQQQQQQQQQAKHIRHNLLQQPQHQPNHHQFNNLHHQEYLDHHQRPQQQRPQQQQQQQQSQPYNTSTHQTAPTPPANAGPAACSTVPTVGTGGPTGSDGRSSTGIQASSPTLVYPRPAMTSAPQRPPSSAWPAHGSGTATHMPGGSSGAARVTPARSMPSFSIPRPNPIAGPVPCPPLHTATNTSATRILIPKPGFVRPAASTVDRWSKAPAAVPGQPGARSLHDPWTHPFKRLAFRSAGLPPLLRQVAIHTSFPSAGAYKACLLAALTEEVNLCIQQHCAAPFHAVLARALGQQQRAAASPRQPAGSAPFQQQPQRQQQHPQQQHPQQQHPQQQHPQQQHPQQQQHSQQRQLNGPTHTSSSSAMLGGDGRQPFDGRGQGITPQGGGSGAGPALQLAAVRGADLEKACRQAHVPFFGEAQLTVVKSSGGQGAFPRKRKSAGGGGGAGDVEDCDGNDPKPQQHQQGHNIYYLTIQNVRMSVKSFRRHDLWIVGSHPHLSGPQQPGQDRQFGSSRSPWQAIARSLWHAPNREGKLEVEWLDGPPKGLDRSQAVCALKGPDISSELSILELLHGSDLNALPLFTHHLCAHSPAGLPFTHVAAAAAAAAAPAPLPKPPPPSSKQQLGPASTPGREPGSSLSPLPAPLDCMAAAERVIDDFGLNPDQADVIRHVGSWLQQPPQEQPPEATAPLPCRPPVCLVHGPFGSGKSSLLVAVITFLVRQGQGMAAASPTAPPVSASPAVATATAAATAVASSRAAARATAKVLAGLSPAAAAAAAEAAAAGAAGAATPSATHRGEPCVERQSSGTRGGGNGHAGRSAGRSTHLPSFAGLLGASSDECEVVETEVHPDDSDDLGADVRALMKRRFSAAAGDDVPAAPTSTQDATPLGLDPEPPPARAGPAAVSQPISISDSAPAASPVVEAARRKPAVRRAIRPSGGQQPAPPLRILVAANTNVAVDRVLLGLLDAGFDDFIRVGSLPRIAQRVLPRSLHSSDDSKSGLTLLREMLREAEGRPEDEAVLRGEIEALQAGAEVQRRKALHTAAVVGATCCALLQPVMDDSRFTIVILDESSQMTEAMSMIPLLRSRCRYVIAAGDPYQLPPVISTPSLLACPPRPPASASTPHPSNPQAPAQPQQQYGLLRPLFVRLVQSGYVPHLLRTQYRCHPCLSAIPNRLFYRGQLRDGGGQGQVDQHTRSSYNNAEAQLVGKLVQLMLSQGLEAADIGVICLYKAQVAAILQVMGAARHAAGHHTHQAPHDAQGQTLDNSSGREDSSVTTTTTTTTTTATEDATTTRRNHTSSVQIATVDSFQGAERDIIILATTLTKPSGEFASDTARLNVALTRAKRHLIVLGSPQPLCATAPVFQAIVNTCQGSELGFYGSAGTLLKVMTQKHAEAVAAENAGTVLAEAAAALDKADEKGNKSRKLDGMMPELRDAGVTDIVTCGGVQSAHISAVAAICTELGMTAHLLVRGEGPAIPTGNYLLASMFGRITFVPRSEYADRAGMMEKHLQRVTQKRGGAAKVAVISEGAGDASALLGCVRLVEYLCSLGVLDQPPGTPYTIVIDSGTGTTAIGVALGIALLDLPWRVVGVRVAGVPQDFVDQEARLVPTFMALYMGCSLREWRELHGVTGRSDVLPLAWVERTRPRRFGKVFAEDVALCRQVARRHGILLDPLYSCAAWEDDS
ncbi:MAG: hypothetical protein WDW36_005553 [Sanguina aurantia]